MLVQARLSGEDGTFEVGGDNVELMIIPAKQENCRTRLLSGEEAAGLFDYLEKLSGEVEIDGAGVARESVQEGEAH